MGKAPVLSHHDKTLHVDNMKFPGQSMDKNFQLLHILSEKKKQKAQIYLPSQPIYFLKIPT